AASIQRLSQADFDPNTKQFYPHYLITNRYTGEDNLPEVFGFPGLTRGDIHGEVFEIRGIDYVVNGNYQNSGRLYYLNNGAFQRNPNGAIVWLAPNETITKDSNNNIHIKRSLGSPDGATTSGLFEQPTFSDRPY